LELSVLIKYELQNSIGLITVFEVWIIAVLLARLKSHGTFLDEGRFAYYFSKRILYSTAKGGILYKPLFPTFRKVRLIHLAS
jgi:hypothetical protein